MKFFFFLMFSIFCHSQSINSQEIKSLHDFKAEMINGELLDSLETISPNNLAGKVIAPLLSIEADIEVCIPKLKSNPVKRSFPVTSSAANKTFANTGCVGRLETALLTN